MPNRIIDNFSGQGSTSGASTATIMQYGLPDNCSGSVKAQVTAVVDGTSPVGQYEVVATFRRGTGNVTVEATSISLTLLPVLGALVSFDASGSDLRLRAAGSILSGDVEWVASAHLVIYTQ